MNETKFVTCPCSNCSGRIEFEFEHAGETVQCPHCSKPTVLSAPPKKANLIASYRSKSEIEAQLHRIGTVLFWLSVISATIVSFILWNEFFGRTNFREDSYRCERCFISLWRR